MKKTTFTRILSFLLTVALCATLVPAAWAAEAAGTFKFIRLTSQGRDMLYSITRFDTGDMEPPTTMSLYGNTKIVEFTLRYSQNCDIELMEIRNGFDPDDPDIFREYNAAAAAFVTRYYQKIPTTLSDPAEIAAWLAQWQLDVTALKADMDAKNPCGASLGYLNVANENDGIYQKAQGLPVNGLDDDPMPEHEPPITLFSTLDVDEFDFETNRFYWDGMVFPSGSAPEAEYPDIPDPEYYLIVVSPKGTSYTDWGNSYLSFMTVHIDNDEPDPSLVDDEFEPCDGDPIGVVTGSFVWEYTDMSLEGEYPLSFTRHYRSESKYSDVMGFGWRHNFQYELIKETYSMKLVNPYGYEIWFEQKTSANEEYKAPLGCDYKLQTNPSGGYDLIHVNGTLYHFDDSGRLEEQQYLNKTIYTLAYDGSLLSSVQGAAGELQYIYDNNGQLCEVQDGTGRSVYLSYTNGELIAAENPDGDSLTYEYTDGRLTTIYDFLGQSYVQNSYDAYGRVVGQDVLDMGDTTVEYDLVARKNTFRICGIRTTVYAYDELGHVTSVTDYLENEDLPDSISVYENGWLMSEIDRLGNATDYTRNDLGLVTSIDYPDGTVESYTYDSHNLPLTHTLPDGGIYEYEYDSRGNLKLETNPEGQETKYSYDSSHRLIHVEVKEEGVFRTQAVYNYNSKGLITEVTDSHGETEQRYYDNVGRLISKESRETGNQQNEIHYEYSAAGKLEKTIEKGETTADDIVTTYEVNGNGYNTLVTEAEGATYRYEYNAQNQLIAAYDSENNCTAYTYDDAGNLSSVTDAGGNTYTYVYDELNRQIAMTDPNDHTTQYEYDAEGRLVKTIDTLSDSTTYWSSIEYDEMGRVVKTTDALGHSFFTEYDENGRVLQTEDELGNQTIYTYDLLGNILTVTDPEGTVTTSVYNDLGQLETVSDMLGNTTTYTYDTEGRVIAVEDPDGGISCSEYDKDGRLTKSIDQLGNETQYEYDKFGRQVKIIYADGSFAETTYDKMSRVLTETDAQGHVTSYTYDILGRTTSVTDALEGVTAYTYDNLGRVLTVTDALGGVTSYTYNALGQTASVTDAEGGVTQYAYDELGRQTSVTDPLGGVTTYTYDVLGNMLTTVNPDGGVNQYFYDPLYRIDYTIDPEGGTVSYTYNGRGQTLTETATLSAVQNAVTTTAYDIVGRVDSVTAAVSASQNAVTQYTYDPCGRTATVTDPMGAETGYTYDLRGQLIQTEDALGNIQTTAYDAMGRTASQTDANGVTRTFVYDLCGNLVTSVDGLAYEEQYQYDALHRMIRYTDRNGSETQYFYDPLGRVVQETDALDNSTFMTYDNLGRVTAVTDKNGNTTQYSLDANGNILQTTDALDGLSFFTYDAMNRLVRVNQGLAGEQETAYTYDYRGLLTSEINPLGFEKTYTYNLGGLLTRQVDEEEFIAEYTYDQMGQMTQSRHSGDGMTWQTSTYTYDLSGAMSGFSGPSGVTNVAYDLLGRVTGVTYPDSRTLGYDWDGAGNLTTLTYADSTQALYDYDAENRISSVTDPNGGVTAFTYDPEGNLLSRLLPSEELTTYVYDALDRVTSQSEGHYTISYAYDPQGNRVEENREVSGRFLFDRDKRPVVGAFRYDYDALNRLVEVSDPHFGVTGYTYDSLGNLLQENGSGGSVQYTYNEYNQLLTREDSRKTTDYAYDNRGNLVHTMETPDGGTPELTAYYAYDVTNRMTEAMNGQNEYTFYTYNALGCRVGETQSRMPASHATVRTYLPDMTALLPRDLMVYTQDKTVERNVYAGSLAQKLTEAMPNYTGSAGVAETLYAHSDALGSLTYLTQEDGDGYMAFDYDAWGHIDPSQTLNDFGFLVTASYTGHDYNFVLGVWFAQARMYDSGTKRFNAVDVVKGNVGASATFNRYTYCLDNPFAYIDPLGLSIVKVEGGKITIGEKSYTDFYMDDQTGMIYLRLGYLKEAYEASTVYVGNGKYRYYSPNESRYAVVSYNNDVMSSKTYTKLGQYVHNTTISSEYYKDKSGYSIMNLYYFNKIMCSISRNKTITTNVGNIYSWKYQGIVVTVPSSVTRTIKQDGKIVETKTTNPRETWGAAGGYGSNHKLKDSRGRYRVAVGPKILRSDYPDDGKIWTSDFPKKDINVILKNKTTGELKILECVVADLKAHSYTKYPDTRYPGGHSTNTGRTVSVTGVANGLVQTGIRYPNASNPAEIIQKDFGSISVVEFCVPTSTDLGFKPSNYTIEKIVVLN